MHFPYESDRTRYCHRGDTQVHVRRYSAEGIDRYRAARYGADCSNRVYRSSNAAGYKGRRTRGCGSAKRNVIVSICLALLVVACVQTLFFAGSNMQGSFVGTNQASTPRSEWCAGEVPYLYQIDPQWANEPYAGGTIAENGCGPTCLSMVYVYLTGRTDLGPVEMSVFAQREGFSEGGATTWSFMSSGAALLGLKSEELPADADVVLSRLRAGHPVVCVVGPGDFTTTGHFIVLSGIDDQGQVRVHDPNSEANSHKAWDIERILPQCRNLWAFG